MRKKILQRISLVSTLALFIQPLSGMDGEAVDCELNQANQVSVQPQQPGLSQAPAGMESALSILRLVADNKKHIFQIVSIRNLKEGNNLNPFGNPLKLLKLVCTDWKNIVDVKNKTFAFANEVIRSAYSLTDDEFEIYQRFVKGKLIYRPEKGSDVGMIKLPISQLWNPLEGTFDLSQCDNTGKYLSISTGYKKEKKPENERKAEIWFTPRFLVEKEIHGSASNFKNIFPTRWATTALVGMIWTWGSWENESHNFDCLTTEEVDNLSKNNLCEKWWVGRESGWVSIAGSQEHDHGLAACAFMLCDLK
jgi:hypothetical protein